MDGVLSMTRPAIELHDLGHCYGERWAIRHLSFTVAPGEILGLLGPNGAGKSTTVRMLTGQLRPSEGRATVAGVDVASGDPALGQRIGVTFEQQNLYERLTVRETLDFFGTLCGVSDTRIREILSEARLEERANDVVSTLSKGLRQRLILARALLGRPQVIFLDEPTSGLDPVAAEALHHWVARLASEGAAVLLTTHDMHEAESLCRHVAVVDRGALLALDTPEALIARVHPPRLHVQLRDTDGIEETTLEGAPAAIAAALAALSSQREVVGLREERATLGQAFLQLTGRALFD